MSERGRQRERERKIFFLEPSLYFSQRVSVYRLITVSDVITEIFTLVGGGLSHEDVMSDGGDCVRIEKEEVKKRGPHPSGGRSTTSEREWWGPL